MQYDWPLDQARAYRPDLPVPKDLEDFWSETLLEAAGPAEPSVRRVRSGLVAVESYDVTFAGFVGHPVRAWLHLPAAALRPEGPLPGVVQYQGYNGGRGLVHEHVFWATAGYAHLVVDTRGQGSGWATGATPDPVGSAPSQPGFLTRGIEDPHTYFYRRAYAEAVAALAPASVAALVCDVPFLCDLRRAASVAVAEPYLELVRYLAAQRDRVEQAFATLAYFDVAVLARLAAAPALFSVAMMDRTCPPSTVFAAYNAYAGPKEIRVYEYNDHEGGEAFQRTRQLAWLGAGLRSR